MLSKYLDSFILNEHFYHNFIYSTLMSLTMFTYALSRKSENQSNEGGISGEGVPDPRVVVQSSVDSDMTGDGFRWRKYGQKVVKGNPYPR